ncbi:MAG: hypothetical protein SWY16_03220 [Cyanobacteriota bacterium]|nr:hypothetical protein [Cyanobacteriota bacterium]
MTESMLNVTLTLSDAESDEEQLQEATVRLADEMGEIEGVNEVYPTPAAEVPANAKSIGGKIINILTAEITPQHFISVLRFLGGRVFDRTIEMKVEGKDKSIELRVSNAKDLEMAIEQAKRFLEG